MARKCTQRLVGEARASAQLDVRQRGRAAEKVLHASVCDAPTPVQVDLSERPRLDGCQHVVVDGVSAVKDEALSIGCGAHHCKRERLAYRGVHFDAVQLRAHCAEGLAQQLRACHAHHEGEVHVQARWQPRRKRHEPREKTRPRHDTAQVTAPITEQLEELFGHQAVRVGQNVPEQRHIEPDHSGRGAHREAC